MEAALANYIAAKIEERDSGVIWITGEDVGTALLDTLKRNTLHALRTLTSFDYLLVITARNIGTFAKQQRMIADALGILDEEEGRLRKIWGSEDELNCYRYLGDGVEKGELQVELAVKIYEKLLGKRYLLVLEDLDCPIVQNQLTRTMGLPRPDLWNKSWWLITTPSTNICNKSRSDTDLILDYRSHILALVYSIYVEASYILDSVFLEHYPSASEAREMVVNCLLYCLLFSPQMDNSAITNELHDQLVGYGIQGQELVKYWIEAGITTVLMGSLRKLIKNEENQIHDAEEDKVWHVFETSKTILEELVNRSLLRQHSPPDSQDAHHPRCIVATNDIWTFFHYSMYFPGSHCGDYLLEGCQQVLPLEEWEKKEHISFMKSKWMMISSLPQGPPRCPKLTTLF